MSNKPKKENEELIDCSICHALVKKKKLKKHQKQVHGENRSGKPKASKAIRLVSKRGTTLTGRHVCTNCEKRVDNPMRYADSNKGSVILCAVCKEQIRQRSFPKRNRDALNIAYRGGSFGGGKGRR